MPKHESWISNVIADIEGSGGVYLAILREWFLSHSFLSDAKKRHMKNALESLDNSNHLGAVNELCWFRFMRDLSLCPESIPENNNRKTPDFKGKSKLGTEFFCEVTTLNVSREDSESISCCKNVSLNQEIEISRIIRKATEEKAEQLQFGYNDQKGMVFVVFDYSIFSGVGTQRPLALAEALLKTPTGLQAMKPYVSAIIYVERYVKRGRSRIRTSQSAVYHNPSADYPISTDGL